MTEKRSAGGALRAAVPLEKPLQLVGVINAYAAVMAERTGYRALYLSGAGVANASFGLPDLALTTLTEVSEDLRRITAVTSLPVLVDADTGWGNAFMIARTVRELCRGGGAGMHIEDQISAKRCGHRPGKALVPADEMVDRIKAATDARPDADFVIMARTDAASVEGVDAAIDRACRYRDAGADMIFPEALTDLSHYRRFAEETGLPILANITEFGVTPLFSTDELAAAGVSLALYPMSAFRAMSAAALNVYRTIRERGSQKSVLELMQSRAELYDFLGYHEYEKKLDRLYGKEES